MVRIFRTSDRIPVKIGELTVVISPLSFDQKISLQSVMVQAREDPMYAVKGARLALKYAVKAVDGLEGLDGQPFQLTLDPDGTLSDDDVDALLNMQETTKLVLLCSSLVAGVPNEVKDPATGKPIKGISIQLPKQKARA